MDDPTVLSISRRRVLRLGIAGAVGAALPAAGCGESSPAAPSTYSSSAITTTGGSGMPDATFVRIPANPSFAFASGGGAEPILTDYCLGVNLVTNDDYRAFVAATGASAPRYWAGGNPPADKGAHPVLWISLIDAQKYCEWRTSPPQRGSPMATKPAQ